MSEENEFESEDDINADDLLYEAHLKIDALIELLIKKKVITEDEYNDMYEKLLNEDIKEHEGESQEDESE
jgi:hypothetical protein